MEGDEGGGGGGCCGPPRVETGRGTALALALSLSFAVCPLLPSPLSPSAGAQQGETPTFHHITYAAVATAATAATAATTATPEPAACCHSPHHANGHIEPTKRFT